MSKEYKVEKTPAYIEVLRVYMLLKAEYELLKSGGNYRRESLNGYSDALWDLKQIIKETYGLSV